MKKWTLFGSGVLLAALAMQIGGCDVGWSEPETPTLETRTFALHHMDAGEAAKLIDPYIYAEREGAPGMASAAEHVLPAISVRETPHNLDRIAAVLAEFDRPSDSTLALRFQLISPYGSEPDPEIADVITELRRFLRFDGYSLAGETFVSLARRQFKQTIKTEEATYSISGAYWPPSKTLDIDLRGTNVQPFETTVVIQPGKTLVLGTVIGDDVTAILVVRSLVTDQIDVNRAQAQLPNN